MQAKMPADSVGIFSIMRVLFYKLRAESYHLYQNTYQMCNVTFFDKILCYYIKV